MDITLYIGPIVTVVVAAVSFYGMVSARLARTEQQITDLMKSVERHNGVIERTFKLESDMNTAYKRIDELKARDEKIEQRIEKLHDREGT